MSETPNEAHCHRCWTSTEQDEIWEVLSNVFVCMECWEAITAPACWEAITAIKHEVTR